MIMGKIRPHLHDKNQQQQIITAICDWYYCHQRPLLWRMPYAKNKIYHHHNPYYVWVSEIMLQQTTVATVMKRFQEFIQKFPTIKDLAQANQDDILATWAGLGYYARARNLYRCAQEIMACYNGEFPRDKKTLLSLPGIGDYTASAIASIAFGQSYIAFDTNIKRVLSRFFADDSQPEILSKSLKQKAQFLAQDENIGAINQALMDIGATICLTKKQPLCQDCPLQTFCLGQKYYQYYPILPPKKKRSICYGHIVIVESHDGTKILQIKQQEKSVYGGMWLLPHYGWLDKKDHIDLPIMFDKIHKSDITIKHVFTHFTLLAEIHYCQANQESLLHNHHHWRWVNKLDIAKSGMPSLMVKVWSHYDTVSSTSKN